MFDFVGEAVKAIGSTIGGVIISIGVLLGGVTEPVEEPVVMEIQQEILTESEKEVSTTTESEPEKRTTDSEIESEVERTVEVVNQPVMEPAGAEVEPLVTEVSEPVNADFTVRCSITNLDTDRIPTGQNIVTKLRVWEGRTDALLKDYAVRWSTSGGRLVAQEEDKEVTARFSDPGEYTIEAEVTHRESGESLTAICPVSIFCDDYECLSEQEKRESKLDRIISVIDDWYDSGDVLYNCSAAESIIRALEYDFTILGGEDLPVFDKEVDCASAVAPAAYRYKIEVLKENL